jgi:YD repeat-containing protein
VLVTSVPAASQETITYTYDDRGRLVSVARTGSVNNGATTNYTLDKADNRTSVVTAGATALPSTATTSPFLVVPLNGLAIIPIPN